jgi:DNA modification methylase
MAEKRKRGDLWYGCYAGGRGDLFTPESNRHPAKMAVALCYRIFEHGRKMGYWKPGDVILDPMAGIFTTGIVGATLGYRIVGIELEKHFIDLAQQNIELLKQKFPKYTIWTPRLIQGDARRLREVLSCQPPVAEVGKPQPGRYISDAPPTERVKRVKARLARRVYHRQSGDYAGGGHDLFDVNKFAMDLGVRPQELYEKGFVQDVEDYGWKLPRAPTEEKFGEIEKWLVDREANLGVGVEKPIVGPTPPVASAVTSPPYADQDLTGHGHFRSRFEPNKANASGNPHEGYSGAVTSPPYPMPEGGACGVAKRGYGPDGADKVGNRTYSPRTVSGAITSPPYTDSISSNKGTFDPEKFVKPGGPHSQANIPSRYSKSHGQIGNLRDARGDIDGVLSSPPYEDSEQKCDGQKARWTTGKDAALLRRKGDYVPQSSMGRGETYLSAILAVYRELHAVLKPQGVVCLVTKNPVKAGAIRRLDADTIRLMEAAGFTLIERKMAMLTEDLGEQGRLEGGTDKIRRERKSFFKRLFERKRPDLAVDHEDVMFFRKV